MFGEKDQRQALSKAAEAESAQNQGDPEEKMGLPEKGIHFLGESTKTGLDGFASKPQELTLSYLCENPKLGGGLCGLTTQKKGKEVVVSETSNQDEKWVERDFLNLSETKSHSFSKRDAHGGEEDEIERENSCREKKTKLESTLNLSLALPDVSLSLTASNALQNADPVVKLRPSKSMQSLGAAPSNNNIQTCSNDFPAASLSYSYSHPFSHNPSCSLTRNSTENYEYSVGRDDQIWCGGEGTNGSVHSRFRPISDGFVALNNSNHGGGGAGGVLAMMQANRVANKDSCNNSLYKTTSCDNLSFFPSELPAKPHLDAYSGDSRKRDSENLRGLEGGEGTARKISRPERILYEIVSESIPVVAQIIQELPEETLQSIKEYLKNLILMPEKRKQLVGLQKRLDRRSDLTKETLLKCQKDQLEILVAVKMGVGSFISGKVQLPAKELIEIFLFMRCRNVNCNSVLPVDDCDCKFCSANKGFCSSCMCPVCMKFDSANNTCSWVGCDVCSHWCHAACGMQKNLIRPGPSLKGPSGTSEVQFHCMGCNHASEMFGFVKDVFVLCAKDWGLEILIKELDCVRQIFRGSEDFKGKELHIKAEELLSKLESKSISPLNACSIIIQFFNHAGTKLNFPASGVPVKELMPTEANIGKDASCMLPSTSTPSKYTVYNLNSSGGRHEPQMNDLRQNSLKAALLSDPKIDDEFHFGKLSKKDGFDSIESIVRVKEAEASMFQSKADEARREAEGYWRIIRLKSENLEEEYAEKLGKLHLQETKERRRKKLEELKVLEDSHCDYFKMKLRMQSEIKGLLERMEATKQQWV
uniref:Protein OBERON 3 n=2 Tax=Rhizophora mucronata TaxID=61149 RepID=A0A2P2KSD5_RHIMU